MPSVRNGCDAIDVLADWLRSRYGGARVLGVGHRVVHGGQSFDGPTILTKQVVAELNDLIPLAPLHQPYNLAAINAVFERLPGVPQVVACFDTSFHRGHPAVASLVPLPRELCKSGLERYGFHGISYEYIASILPGVAPEIADGRVIVAHLGSGASLCALQNGKSIDSTPGLHCSRWTLHGDATGSTGSRCHPLSIPEHRPFKQRSRDHPLQEIRLLGISEISNDMRDLLIRSEPEARLAVDYFVYRATKEIGALTAVLKGIDALVFTAGIGENSPEIRRRICEASAWLGIDLDEKANTRRDSKISTRQSKVSVWVIPTNEELMIARHTASLLRLNEPLAAPLARDGASRAGAT